MSSKEVCDVSSKLGNKNDASPAPVYVPTAADIDFLLSPNSTTLDADPTTEYFSNAGYDTFKRNLLRTRQTFKVRGLHCSPAQSLEQVLDHVHKQINGTRNGQLLLISGHLVNSDERRNDARAVQTKKVEERNRTFLEKIIPAIHRQLEELKLVSPCKLWKQGFKTGKR